MTAQMTEMKDGHEHGCKLGGDDCYKDGYEDGYGNRDGYGDDQIYEKQN